MGGFFAVASKESCVLDLFYGTDYHSHLGTRRAGMAVYGENGFDRAIHNIQNSPFRTKFEKDVEELKGNLGIGCISDFEPQPLLVNSHLGSFAITTVGKIANADALVKECYNSGKTHFLEMSGGSINPTEIAAAIINQKDSILDGLKYLQEKVIGSLSVLILTKDGIFASRDRLGRTPIVVGQKENAFCLSFENFAYFNLGYKAYKELGPAEIVFMTAEGVETLSEPQEEMKMCSFLWVYYGYPTSSYEGVNVEEMRYETGRRMARRDNVQTDFAAGVPDSGVPAAVGYANEAHVPFARPFIKYTPTWPRSFMPTSQEQRNMIARMKLIPVQSLIKDKKLLLVDDSIVRGTQLGETTEFLYESGAKEVHVRPACPPIMYGCKYLNFSRSTSEMDLIARRVILEREGEITDELLEEYTNPDSEKYQAMVQDICERLGFTSLQYARLDDIIDAIGISPCKLCTYCWNGKE
ncbi:MAG: amidophosphoribosyltransferase [Agathobacter sp.]|nr:amidophosphoribosyltransferase [Agathobacter sp.]